MPAMGVPRSSWPARAPQGCVSRTRTTCGAWLLAGCRAEATHVIPCSFPAKKYKKVTGKEIYSDTLESTPMLEKEKFPQDYFPEVGHGRRPFRTVRFLFRVLTAEVRVRM